MDGPRALPRASDAVKALSVKQPWAELIASGKKKLEVRSWTTEYRGPLLIVASRGAEITDCRDAIERGWVEPANLITRGAAVCLVDVVGVLIETKPTFREQACARTRKGDYLWVLANPRRVPSRPIRGQLMLYDVDWD